ncbi:hypothetical protein KP509_06G041300 [Ceratopteris richardii]|uniref:Uncharacterized protein n=1 Tax=Ceratopteris richardii TaxID=49495 RepID=A0A8T2UHH1_CERRI|nr:hypothetical protein KP509_06G041300 [Ceratopteris richardii]
MSCVLQTPMERVRGREGIYNATRGEASSHHTTEELSDDDCSLGQVVYHENHLENLFGLYNRTNKHSIYNQHQWRLLLQQVRVLDMCICVAKHGGHLQGDLLKKGKEEFKDHLALTTPSDREMAVWGALEASETVLREALQVPENSTELVWKNNLQGSCMGEQLSGVYIGEWHTNRCSEENVLDSGCEQTEASGVDIQDSVNRAVVHQGNGWEHAYADMNDMQGHVLGSSPANAQKTSFVKSKAESRKRHNLSFRSMLTAGYAQDGEGQSSEYQKLPLAQKLQSLVEPSRITRNTELFPQFSNPSTSTMSAKLLELVRDDARGNLHQKMNSEKRFDTTSGTSLVLSIKEELGDKSSMPVQRISFGSINDQLRKALLEAPTTCVEVASKQTKEQGTISGFSARLQKVLDQERNNRHSFLQTLQTKDAPSQSNESCMYVKVVSKNLEARLLVCECKILKSHKAYDIDETSNSKVVVIFNTKANSQLELESGSIIRLYPPWQEVLVENRTEVTRTILCTYFCRV